MEMTIPTWTITNHEYLNFLYSDTITPEEDYFLRLRHHHRNLLALPEEEKIRLLPTFEGQLVSLVKETGFWTNRAEHRRREARRV